MAKILGVRQQRCQFFYDTDFLTAGAQSSSTPQADIAQATKILFAAATPGNFSRTNMPAPGQLTSDQTFLCFAVRHEIFFYGGSSPTAPSGSANPVGLINTAAVSCLTINLSTFRLQIGEKVEFEGPISMTPAGGGPWGFVGDSTQPLITNGEPQNRSIYVLPLPIAITVRQGIRLEEAKGSISSTVNVTLIDLINGYTGYKQFRAYLDGLNTRDVQ